MRLVQIDFASLPELLGSVCDRKLLQKKCELTREGENEYSLHKSHSAI